MVAGTERHARLDHDREPAGRGRFPRRADPQALSDVLAADRAAIGCGVILVANQTVVDHRHVRVTAAERCQPVVQPGPVGDLDPDPQQHPVVAPKPFLGQVFQEGSRRSGARLRQAERGIHRKHRRAISR